MLVLDTKLKIDDDAIRSANLCDRFSERDLERIGAYCWEGYKQDKDSRAAWERRVQAALDLALQIQKDKTFPWQGASNVAFPLITIAALQFHARAYPMIVQSQEVVKCRVLGDDPDGHFADRARRVGMHMSYQCLEEDESWEEQHDKALIALPIMGCLFKKSYYSAGVRHNVSELVLPTDLVVDYFAKSVEGATRKTHITPLFRNDIYERILRGTFRDVRDQSWYKSESTWPQDDTTDAPTDDRRGQMPPEGSAETPFKGLEQHCDLDLDQDGYAEPYIITFEQESKCVLRLITRFDKPEDVERTESGEIISIRSREYFTKYSFIPSPDGSIYDIGFGILLGPLNESVNSLINQLIDAGTMSNTAGGFLGRGAKIRGGVYQFSPFSWNRVDSTGDDLRKNIFPLPVRDPSAVLFNLLALLIDYSNRVSGSTDAVIGENPGQNTPAETNRSMVEQGTKIYTAVFKRVWRSMKQEFKKLYLLNATFLPSKKPFGAGNWIMREDYLGDPDMVVPVADPNVVSETIRMQQATAVKQSAMVTPGYSIPDVERNYLKAMHIEDMARLYPGPDKVPPLPNPKVNVEQMKLQGKQMELKQQQQEFIANLMETKRLNTAKILELEARAMKEASEASAESAGIKIKQFDAQINALKAYNEMISGSLEQMKEGMKDADAGAMAGMAGASGNSGPAGMGQGQAGQPQGAMG
jgi:chaperonin GroES